MKRYDNNDFLLITLIERFNLQYKDKLEEYNYLLEEIDTEYINRTYIDKYINNKNDFLQEAECISSSIGEVVIREYLNSIIKKLREYDKRNINEPQ